MLRNVLILLLVTLTGLSAFAHVPNNCEVVDEHVMPASDDRWVPWPWTLAQPFPWGDIQGFWKVEQNEFVSYFAFKVVREKSTGIRQLQVTQYDGETCRVISTGVGIERNQKVLAQMTSRGGITYRVQLTSFDEKDSPIPPLRSNIPVPSVMVLSMGTLDAQGLDNMYHMQIAKISAFVGQRMCSEDIKKLK